MLVKPHLEHAVMFRAPVHRKGVVELSAEKGKYVKRSHGEPQLREKFHSTELTHPWEEAIRGGIWPPSTNTLMIHLVNLEKLLTLGSLQKTRGHSLSLKETKRFNFFISKTVFGAIAWRCGTVFYRSGFQTPWGQAPGKFFQNLTCPNKKSLYSHNKGIGIQNTVSIEILMGLGITVGEWRFWRGLGKAGLVVL